MKKFHKRQIFLGGLVIILCCLFALGLPRKAALWLKRVFPGPAAVGEGLFNFLLLTAVTAYLL